MSLVVWLPLNGTLENKGISNAKVTNNNATIDTDGKMDIVILLPVQLQVI